MNIGLTVDGPDLNSVVSHKLSECNYLLIVNISDFSSPETVEIIDFKSIIKKENESGIDLAKVFLEYDCEAVISGDLQPEEFNLIADACITRYRGSGYSAVKALELMNKRLLNLIRNIEGTDECDDSHYKH